MSYDMSCEGNIEIKQSINQSIRLMSYGRFNGRNLCFEWFVER